MTLVSIHTVLKTQGIDPYQIFKIHDEKCVCHNCQVLTSIFIHVKTHIREC